ncbi:hypothetical protein H6P81_016385 [Aristolochia fimbriata]|uniref:Core Histone H2A/H2B/H3 domain-containing protein n=1 Tax=Aristolochia fimbriata TaxID=158543 RepID=A0AAV7EA88_ARIFI|nr:hypothetical protein H6P81_016385 [Aristolochia fimbriata]
MAPKAEKKPAEKKPASEKPSEEKKSVADKAPAEKKPKAEKRLPKEGGGVSDKKKKRVKKSSETYKIYIFKVLKQVHPDIGISSKAMGIMNSFINDIFEKLAQEASRLARYNKKPTITSREIQTSLPRAIAKMESVVLTGEEEALLVPGNSSPRSHERDVHILSFAFLFVFAAYGAVQNLESTANKEKDLGTTSMGILYLSFTIFSLVASSMVRVLGLKNSLVLGTTGYWLFIASHLKPSLYTMVPASLYLGFAASIIWVGQGTYLTSVARSHASDCNLHEGTVIGRFNGEFWGMFASTQVIGNLVSLALLRGEEGGSLSGRTLLYTVFLASVTVGIILMFALSNRDAKTDDLPPSSTNFYATLGSLLKLVISPLCDKKMLLIIPLLAYSGLQQAFLWDYFNKYIVEPALGVPGVGGVMAVFGAADVICSVVAGRSTSDLSSVTLIVSGGAFLQLLVLLSFLLKYSMTSGVVRYIFPLLVAVIWGIGDGIFNTQLNATLGMLFKHDTEAAFAQLKVWQSAATSLVFFASPYMTFDSRKLVSDGFVERGRSLEDIIAQDHHRRVQSFTMARSLIRLPFLAGDTGRVVAYAVSWAALLAVAVAVASMSPELAFVSAISPSSSFSKACGWRGRGSVRVPVDEPGVVVCLPAQLFFGRSKMDLVVAPVFAALVVTGSAFFLKALALWEL